MRIGSTLQALAALALLIAPAHAQTAPPEDAPGAGATDAARPLLFEDNFDGGALDRARWNAEGMAFWVNNEQQAYADSPDTIQVVPGAPGADGSVLVLRPVFRPGADTNAARKADFLSGRIDTSGHFAFTHGRAEARIRMTGHRGVWPAFWLLGAGEWPGSGEIDIMEYVGEQDWTGVALHGPGYSGETPLVDKFVFPEGEDVTGWHTYAVEWTAQQILFAIDGRTTYRVTRPMVEHYGPWAFDTPKYIIANFALGGAYPYKTNGVNKPYSGLPADTVAAIKRGAVQMEIDWVRVWGEQP